MPKELKWNDTDEIGVLLSQKHPLVNPLEIPYSDLHRYVTELPDFKDKSPKPSDDKLESIQAAWHAEFLDRTQG